MDRVARTTSVLSVPAGNGAAGLRRVETALRNVVVAVALVLGVAVAVALVFGMGLGVGVALVFGLGLGVEVTVGSEPSAVAGLSWGAVVDLVVVAAAPAAQQDAVPQTLLVMPLGRAVPAAQSSSWLRATDR